jgi:hypothetical protein
MPDGAPQQAAQAQPYRTEEMRVQLSVRTKVAQGLLTDSTSAGKDSLWFGYTQQSYWQLFSPAISRPFRNTDHEPEIFYVYPTDARLPFGWRWRYSGVGLVHQSNGQSNPLSRSWNRVYLMTGMELDNRWTVTGRLWKRLSESADSDDNPGISDYVGRGELAVFWNANKDNTLGATFRSALSSSGRGSVRLFEIPTDLEINDNIVAFWIPEGPVMAGEEREFAYRLRWGSLSPDEGDPRAWVAETRGGVGGVSGVEASGGTRKFVVDFRGGQLAQLGEDAEVTAVTSITGGVIETQVLVRIPDTGSWRLVLDVAAEPGAVVELGAHVAGFGRKLTEQWLYQWVVA